MARRTITIEEKISTKKAEIAKLQERLDKAEGELKELELKADEAKKKELVDMILKSGKSEEEIKEFFSK